MRRADAVLFTGSPPLMLHFIAPLNLLLRKKLIYRITDFHPECLIAERGRAGFILGLLLRLTQFWRRRVDQFEVLGFDQARRLAECGIEPDRIILKRDPSPVTFPPQLSPVPLPDELRGASGSFYIPVTGALPTMRAHLSKRTLATSKNPSDPSVFG